MKGPSSLVRFLKFEKFFASKVRNIGNYRPSWQALKPRKCLKVFLSMYIMPLYVPTIQENLVGTPK
jgi:hypothetical protein